jgi:hypothetical protein
LIQKSVKENIMGELAHRERVALALTHQEADRVPVDL